MSEDNKTGDSAGSRPTVTEDSVPRLPRHVKFRFDQARDAWVVLAPEKVFIPDEIAVEILKRCNGSTTLRDIIDDLAKTFEAERDVVATDVVTLLQDLADKGIITP
jgi:pyrroloquinoline quinone biosynthesis protein D